MSGLASETKSAKNAAGAPGKSRMIDLLALSGVVGLGDDGIAGVWQKVRQDGGALTKFYNSGPDRLRTHYGLSVSAAKYVCQHGDELRIEANDLFQRAQDLGVVIL